MKDGIVPAEFFLCSWMKSPVFVDPPFTDRSWRLFWNGKTWYLDDLNKGRRAEPIYLLRGSYRLNLRWFKVVQIHLRWRAFWKLRHFNPWFLANWRPLTKSLTLFMPAVQCQSQLFVFRGIFVCGDMRVHAPLPNKKGALLVHHNLKYQIL